MIKEQVEKRVCENDNYFNGEDSFADYYHQAIKNDARKYGDIFMEDYSITPDAHIVEILIYPSCHLEEERKKNHVKSGRVVVA